MEFINANVIESMFVLAIIVEWIIEAIKPIWSNRVSLDAKSNITRLMSILVGIGIIFTTNVVLFNLGNPVLDVVLTGLAISAGSGALNMILSKITGAKKEGKSIADQFNELTVEEQTEFSLHTIDELSGTAYKEHAQELETEPIVEEINIYDLDESTIKELYEQSLSNTDEVE